MGVIEIVAFFLGAFLLSYILTYLARRYSVKHRILDVPNHRSSHEIPTPRGGGLAFVIVFLAGLTMLFLYDRISMSIWTALVGGGGLISLIGWIDDRQGLSARFRLVAQFFAAVWAVFFLGGMPSLNLGFTEWGLSWWGNLLAVIGIVWIINLYNFMDGIDGLAGTEAVSVSVIAAIFLWPYGQSVVCLLLAASVLGFLLWNWPPAKIFMGDVGSGFLGFVFAVLALWTENIATMPLLIWVIILGVFIVDASLTLIKRIIRREKLYEAHRSHMYQLAVQTGYSHKRVTLTVLGLNVVFGGIAVFASKYSDYMLPAALLTALTLAVIYFVLRNLFNSKINLSNTNAECGEEIIHQSIMEAAAVKDTSAN